MGVTSLNSLGFGRDLFDLTKTNKQTPKTHCLMSQRDIQFHEIQYSMELALLIFATLN